MAAVDASFGAWLRADGQHVAAVSPAAASWVGKAVSSTIMSPLALAAEAAVEAGLQAAFLGAGPFAIDEHVVSGRRSDLVARLVTMSGDRLGYEAAPDVFVLGADETRVAGATVLTVLKRMI